MESIFFFSLVYYLLLSQWLVGSPSSFFISGYLQDSLFSSMIILLRILPFFPPGCVFSFLFQLMFSLWKELLPPSFPPNLGKSCALLSACKILLLSSSLIVSFFVGMWGCGSSGFSTEVLKPVECFLSFSFFLIAFSRVSDVPL